MTSQITLTKRICMADAGYQFITSGFPNRSRDKKTFDSVDGMFIQKPLIEDLRATEGGAGQGGNQGGGTTGGELEG